MDIIVALPADLVEYVEAEVAAGRYASSSDVVQGALRLLERADRQGRDPLREAWHEGIASGEGEDLDFADLKIEGRKRLTADN